MTPSAPNVAILGAGLCGLLIANELKQKNILAHVFEKSRGTGGRMASKHWEWGQANIGAQYFTARDNDFRELINSWVEEGIAKQWNFTPYKIENGKLVASPDNGERFVGSPDMTSITRYLARNISITTNVRIEKCALEENQQWTLVDGNKQQHGPFDFVITTLPAEQSNDLFPLHTELHREIHRPCWAVALATKCISGSQIPSEIQGIFGDEQFSWVSRQSALQNVTSQEFDDIWLLHSAPQWTTSHGKDYSTHINQTAKTWLEKTLQQALTIVHQEHHFWRYANIVGAPNADIRVPSDTTVLSSNESSLLISGAWQHSGKVEGAFLAARDCVKQLTGALNN